MTPSDPSVYSNEQVEDDGKGRLFIVSGPSGCGKSTLLNALFERKPELGYSVSYTTRPPRGGEKDGVDYRFVDEVSFRKKIEEGELAEWAEVHGCLYGTSASFIDENVASGRDVLLDIDVQGAAKIRAKYPGALSVFVVAPTIEELERRIVKRGADSPEAIVLRLENAEAEMAQASRYDHVIVNDDLADSVAELEGIIERQRRANQ